MRIPLAILSLTLLLAGCPAPNPPETLVLADIRQPVQGLVYVADRLGYFREENLQVSYKPFVTGRAAMTALHAGEVDVAHAFEMPVVTDAVAGKPLRIIGTLARTNQNNAVVARRDRGIATAADLRGKRIGLPPGSSTDYMVALMLKENAIAPQEVMRLPMAADQVADALANGKVDAIATWQPHVARAQAALPGDATVLFRTPSYTELTMLVVRPDTATTRPEPLHRLLRALVRAEDYLARHMDEGREIVVQWLADQPAAGVRDGWPHLRHQVRLDNLLLTVLGNEAAWLAGQQQPSPSALPDFRRLMATEYLAAARPEAVTVKAGNRAP